MEEWRRYAAPAGFLLAVTVAVVLIRAGLEHGGDPAATTTAPPARTRVVHVTTTTAAATTTTRRPAPARRYWTVQAGDTFSVIASRTGVPVTEIEQLNPKLSSNSLTIGERVRIR